MGKKFGNIYFDTNILKSLNFNIHEDPYLGDLRKLIKIDIYIPKIVLDELLYLRINELEVLLEQLKLITKRVNTYTISGISSTLKEQGLSKELREKMEENIKKSNIGIFETPFANTDFKKIVDMAVNKKRPFGEKGKGFQDMVILLSVLEHCKIKKDYDHFFVTANRKDYDHEDVFDIIKENKVNLKIFYSLDDLLKYFNEFLEGGLKAFIAARERELKEFLSTHSEDILDFVRKNVRFDSIFFNLSAGDIFRKIEDISFKEIRSVSAGYLDKDLERDVEISFMAKLIFNLSVEKTTYRSPSFKVGEEPAVPFPTLYREGFATVNAEKDVKFSGKIHIKKENGIENYTNLKLEQAYGSVFSRFAAALAGTSYVE